MKKSMKRTICVTVVVALICSVPISSKVFVKNSIKADTFHLVWSDEFRGTNLDTSSWNYEVGAGGWGNNELQNYTDREDNVYLSDDCLHIKAKREYYAGSQFTSGRIQTKKKRYFKYGKMEARIRVNGGNQNGVWPAFWMMGNDYDRNGWPRCGELDIMEHANSNRYVEGTLHWGPSWQSHSMWGSGDENKYHYFDDNQNNGINGWHKYGIIWDSENIIWYVDNHQFLTANIGEGYDSHSYFQKDAFFILNLALGSVNTGYTQHRAPDADFTEATMDVDYVRAYQLGPDDQTDAPTTEYSTTTTTTTEHVTSNVATKSSITSKKTAPVKLGKSSIKKVTRKKKSLKITLKKIKGATGYQIRYSDSKNFDGYWEKNVKKPKVKLKKLDRKTKYYIKARAYKKKGNIYFFGKFSKKKKAKTK